MPDATVLCLDNCEFMRNGDFLRSRFAQQREAASMVARTKFSANPENSVGLVASSGAQTVLLSLTSADGRFSAALHAMEISGEGDPLRAVYVAQLMLSHRRMRTQAQRIVMFIGSPLRSSDTELRTLGRFLRMNLVAIDVIELGTGDPERTQKLRQLVEATTTQTRTCHLLTLPPNRAPGMPRVSESVALSAIVPEAAQTALGAGPGQLVAGDDPELARALRQSLQDAQGGGGGEVGGGGGAGIEDPELAQAIQISLLEHQRELAERGGGKGGSEDGSDPDTVDGDATTDADLPVGNALGVDPGMDPELALAIQISLVDQGQGQPGTEDTAGGASGKASQGGGKADADKLLSQLLPSSEDSKSEESSSHGGA